MAIPLPADLLQQVMAASLDYYVQREPTVIDKEKFPLLDVIERSSRPFTGAKEKIIEQVVFGGKPVEKGFQGDDVLEFSRPTGLRWVTTEWKNRHIGLEVLLEELQRNGLTITDTTAGMDVRNQAGAARVQLANLMEVKMERLMEGRRRSRAEMFWKDGTQDSKDVPGILYWVRDNVTSSVVVGGIDQGAVPEWRNRVALNINASLANASDGVLMQRMQKEWRQLTRYEGRPTHIFAGSDFIEQLENEYGARGTWFQEGFVQRTQEVAKAGFSFRGIEIQYEPMLDDLNRSKYAYFLNFGPGGFRKYHMEGWKDRKHFPARPAEKFVFRMSLTTVDALICTNRRSNLVMSIA